MAATKHEADAGAPFDCVYLWPKHPAREHLNGRACRILAFGASKHALLVEFETGERIVAPTRAISVPQN